MRLQVTVKSGVCNIKEEETHHQSQKRKLKWNILKRNKAQRCNGKVVMIFNKITFVLSGTRIDQLAAMSCARVKCKENTSDQTKKQSSEMLGAKCPAPKVLGIREVKQSPTSPVDTAPLQSPSKPKTLYRRPLPESCIAFASEEGKTIFREALATGK